MLFFLALTLAVPYLPQTEALCGGAAAAMVFRFWGDRHADVQQFEPLVDRKAGGIADTVLVDAIRSRGWNAERIDGSLASIRAHIAAGEPLILLIEDRPFRYHYVVAVGADEQQIVIHDPTWGPARRFAAEELVRRWRPTGFWTLLVTSSRPSTQSVATRDSHDTGSAAADDSRCRRLLDAALDQIQTRGPEIADAALSAVGRACPETSAPLSELAGVRFSQRRWEDATRLAQRAIDKNTADTYAWDVLGSSRFILNDTYGALRAWNRIGKPMVDSVQITGLSRTRYAWLAQLTGIAPNTLLTSRQLALANRRIGELPDRTVADVSYRPEDDGFATVNVRMVERSILPRTPTQWPLFGAEAAIDREISMGVPGTAGQGERWQATWRWWDNRPRVGMSFTAPRVGRIGGVWRVDASWEAQTYRGLEPSSESGNIRQEQTSGGISYANWLSPDTRIEAASGLDAWNDGSGDAFISTLRAVRVGAGVEQRLARDRIAIGAAATAWWAGADASPFQRASIRAVLRTTTEPSGLVGIADVRFDVASADAPLAIWSGAGEGRARPALLRAHPLLEDGVITGPAFGRTLQSTTVEVQRWLMRPVLPRIGIAAFVDSANAGHRLGTAAGERFQADAGAGIRFHLPGSERTIRVDYAHGIRDRNARAVTFGFELER